MVWRSERVTVAPGLIVPAVPCHLLADLPRFICVPSSCLCTYEGQSGCEQQERCVTLPSLSPPPPPHTHTHTHPANRFQQVRVPHACRNVPLAKSWPLLTDALSRHDAVMMSVNLKYLAQWPATESYVMCQQCIVTGDQNTASESHAAPARHRRGLLTMPLIMFGF
jgi:hypothetical protein